MNNIFKKISLFTLLVMEIVAYSGNAMQSVTLRAMGLGIDFFVLKVAPNMTNSQLYQEINTILGNPINSKLIFEGKAIPNNESLVSKAYGIYTETVFAINRPTNSYSLIQKYAGYYNNVSSAFTNKDVNGIVENVKLIGAINPDSAAALFQNGNVLGYSSLNNNGFSADDINQIVQSSGLSADDIATYMKGTYTGASDALPDVPNIPSGPGGGPTNNAPSTGTGIETDVSIPGAQQYYNLTEVTKANLQQLITQNQLTQTEFNALLANQKANLAKLQEEGTASAEEIAEMTNEINISEQVASDPDTKFAPDPVEPVDG